MKHLRRNLIAADVLDLHNTLAHERSLTLAPGETDGAFASIVAQFLADAKRNPTLLYGQRTEAMFGYMAAALGGCMLVKREDAGDVISADPELRIPDYHLVLRDGSEFCVEVKNYSQSEGTEPFSLKCKYLESLQKYCNILKRDLKVAIYWHKWNIWTLVPVSGFDTQGDRHVVTLPEAFKHNEMTLLGDIAVATTPPLLFRLITNAEKPRSVDTSGNVVFSVARTELYCAGNLIEDPIEQGLALYLMFFGSWEGAPAKAFVENGELIHLDYEVKPHEPVPGQEFDIVGQLSSMISLHYRHLTAREGQVLTLTPRSTPETLGVVIPEDYKGKQLPLWRFRQQSGEKQV